MFKETEVIKALYTARLENGVILFVYDGYGEGNDGNIYKPVLDFDEDGDCEVIGWEIAEK